MNMKKWVWFVFQSFLLLSIVVFIWIGYWYLSYDGLSAIMPLPSDDLLSKLAAFGDMFGALNTLFSGLAFGGLVVTLVMQMRELGLQREELAKTREVFDLESTILKEQRDNSVRQRKDAAFFSLLSVINDFRRETKITGNCLAHLKSTKEEFEKLPGHQQDPFEFWNQRLQSSIDLHIPELVDLLGEVAVFLKGTYDSLTNQENLDYSKYISLAIVGLTVSERVLIHWHIQSEKSLGLGRKFDFEFCESLMNACPPHELEKLYLDNVIV
jgi:hypothetical protein